jgi:hypothetical protein
MQNGRFVFVFKTRNTFSPIKAYQGFIDRITKANALIFSVSYWFIRLKEFPKTRYGFDYSKLRGWPCQKQTALTDWIMLDLRPASTRIIRLIKRINGDAGME